MCGTCSRNRDSRRLRPVRAIPTRSPLVPSITRSRAYPCLFKLLLSLCVQYTDDLSELNDMEEGGLPHEELVNSIRTESRQLQEIVRENRILRAMVAEHQTALEMIMSKYRSQVSHLVTQTKADRLMTDLTAKVSR